MTTRSLTWVGSVLEGAESALVPALIKDARLSLLVVPDDAQLARVQARLAFFAPDHRILGFPAWDCLPYDRVGPSRDLVSARLKTLMLLRQIEAKQDRKPTILVVTVNALLQRVVPAQFFDGQVLRLKPGGTLAPAQLTSFLALAGYAAVSTVTEPGEFAQRGGLIDVFPTGAKAPVRIDFFDDEIDTLKHFDPAGQRTTKAASALTLLPASEIPSHADARERFRLRYRETFGATGQSDPLYAALSEGRAYAGQEHWQPLFFEGALPSLLSYLPAAAPLILDCQVQEAAQARLEAIEDFYQARLASLEVERAAKKSEQSLYYPIRPETLYWQSADWDRLTEQRQAWHFSSFDVPAQAALPVLTKAVRPGISFAAERRDPEANLYEAVRREVRSHQKSGGKALIACASQGSKERLKQTLFEAGVQVQRDVTRADQVQALDKMAVGFAVLPLAAGFRLDRLLVLTEQDVLGERLIRPRKRKKADAFLRDVESLSLGDLVVHVDHGIGRYEGLETLDLGGAPHDVLHLAYAGGDRLYLPVENVELLSRYGDAGEGMALDRLGSAAWQNRKARAKRQLFAIAEGLMAVAAARQLKSAPAFDMAPDLMAEFAARFPYVETDDQQDAIEDVLQDLTKGRPMDRLVVGDVGFGKTEVAIRAAFAAAMQGAQVAVVVPTTLLARQHTQTFAERFADTSIRVEHISRLVTGAALKSAKERIAQGQAQIIIGTHGILAPSFAYHELGLVIVDEEQRFGVKQKERLKQLRENVHVLTLTATPIPRTLQLALTGVKELSLIATPPVDRLSVRTFVMPWDPLILREALMREHFRGGQSFIVCPRIRDLADMEERLGKLVPELKSALAHGSLAPADLEDIMEAFTQRKIDILLSTNIVESGIDIATANTLIIHKAHMFGLSALYQLRGRVGRSKQRGYAYLTLPQGHRLTPAAEKRLAVMKTLDGLGAGFNLASHDLDIRGAGNLVGEEQSGHIKEVGVELYQSMLEEAVQRAKLSADLGVEGLDLVDTWSPQINLGMSVLIPATYVGDLGLRLALYRRLGALETDQDREGFAAELIDRFGALPPETENLLAVIGLKILAKAAGVHKVEVGPKGAVLTFWQNAFAAPEALMDWCQKNAQLITVRADQRLFYRHAFDADASKVPAIKRILTNLKKLAQSSNQK